MVRSSLVVALTCAAMVACTGGGMTQRERLIEQQVVEERVATWVRVMNNARVDSLVAMYMPTPDCRKLWADGRRSIGAEQLEQDLRAFYSSINYMNFVLQDPVVEILSPGHALTTFRHSTDVVQAGGAGRTVAPGQGALVWVKDPADRLWKIHLEHISVLPPPQMN